MTTPPLKDDADRQWIIEDTTSNLFVEAGAGSGKTSSLVERVTRLVMHDRVPLTHIAAVTFTEKAGAELRDRLRAHFESKWRDAQAAPADKEFAGQALEDLDSAAIGTLHSFAHRILTKHPILDQVPVRAERPSH